MLKNSDLAINGGSPVRTTLWKDNITTGEEEKRALSRVIDSGYLSLFEGSHTPDAPFSFKGGPFVQAFENQAMKMLNAPYAVSVNSATSGLYAAVGALGIGYGDEVIVSPYTMSACATAPLVYGAIPIFADVELNSGSLCPKSIRTKITKRTKAILVVHQFGIPANMTEIMAIAEEFSLKVIEDCAQAWGAKYAGKSVGTIGHIGVFSLNVNKAIQTGEGGLCITNDPELAYRLELIRNHGEAVVGPAGYQDITNIIGYNYRLTELQAAVAVEQLKKLPLINEKRLELVEQFINGIKENPLLEPLISKESSKATYYIVPMKFNTKISKGVTREQFIAAVNAEGALFYQGYVKPLYFQPIYQTRQAFKKGYPWAAEANKESNPDYSEGSCPNAEQLHFNEMIINEHIRLPQSSNDINELIEIMNKITFSVI